MAEIDPFPLLDDEAILNCLKELGIVLSKEQLRNPSQEVMQGVYDQLLNIFLGYTPDEQMHFSGTQIFEHPGLFTDAIAQLHFLRSTQKLASTCFCRDFGMHDIVAPNYRRTRRILSGIINFAKHHTSKVNFFDALVLQNEDLEIALQQAENEHRELTNRLQAHKQKRHEEEPQVEELSKECSRLTQRVRELHAEQADLTKKSSDIKAARAKLQDKMASDQFQFMALEKDRKKLQSQIVRSPERAKKELKELRENVDAEAAEGEEFERKAQEYQHKIDVLTKIHKDISGMLRLLQEMSVDQAKAQGVKEEVVEVVAKTQSTRQVLGEWQLKEAALKKQIKVLADRAADMQSKHQLREDATARDSRNARAAQVEAEKENRKAREELEQIETHKAGYRNAKLEREQQHADHQKAVTSEFARTEAELQQYHRVLLAAMGDAQRDY